MSNFKYSPVSIKYVFNGGNIIAIYQKTDSSHVPNKYLVSDVKINNGDMEYRDFRTWQKHITMNINDNDMVWGAAGKGVMMMNILKLTADRIPFICDKNHNIWGKFIPITANKIISQFELKKHEFSKIIVMNKVYLSEIKDEIANMNINTKVVYIGDLIR